MSDILLKGLGVAALSCGLALAGCSGSDDDDDSASPTAVPATPTATATATATEPAPTDPPTPTVTPTAEPLSPVVNITVPARDGTARPLGTDPNLSVGFTIAVIGYRLADPDLSAEEGGCGEQPNCGHVYIYIDDDAGNQTGMPYNNIGFGPQVNALFVHTDNPVGEHTVKIELRHNDGTAVTTGSGEHIFDERTINTTIAVPSINILTPADGSTQKTLNDADYTINVTFGAPNVTLEEDEADCAGIEFCGLVEGLLDDEKVAEAFIGTIAIPMAEADDPTGEHKITLRLVKHDGTVYEFDNPTTEEGAVPVQDSITITTELPEGSLNIVGLTEGQVLRLGNDPLNTTAVNYALVDLQAGDQTACGNASIPCGQIQANLDGDSGNGPGLAFNSFSTAATSIQTYFSYLGATPAQFGTHTIKLSMWDYSGSQITQGGDPIEDEVTIFAISQTDPNMTLTAPTEGAEITLDPNADPNPQLPVVFRATQFQVAEEGSCLGALPCGFVKVYLDGSFVADAFNSPYLMDMTGKTTGTHTVKVELHAYEGGQVSWPYDEGVDIAHEVTITTAESGSRVAF